MNIKKGDKVMVLLGKDRGKTSVVEKALIKEGKVLVTDVNKAKRHIGKKTTGGEGGIVEIAKPIDISNVVLVCPSCQKPTRVGFQITKGAKMRICKKCEKEIVWSDYKKNI